MAKILCRGPTIHWSRKNYKDPCRAGINLLYLLSHGEVQHKGFRRIREVSFCHQIQTFNYLLFKTVHIYLRDRREVGRGGEGEGERGQREQFIPECQQWWGPGQSGQNQELETQSRSYVAWLLELSSISRKLEYGTELGLEPKH